MVDVPLFPDPIAKGGRIGAPGDDRGYIAEVSIVGKGANKRAQGHFVIAKRAKDGTVKAPGLKPNRISQALGREVKKAVKVEAAAPTPGISDDKEMTVSKAMKDGMKQCPKCKGSKTFGEPPADCPKCKGTGSVAMKAKAAKAAMPDGHVTCPSCDGGKIRGELDCPKCEGIGHIPKEKAMKSTTAKDDGPTAGVKVPQDPDGLDDVTDAIQGNAADGDDKSAKSAKSAADVAKKAAKKAKKAAKKAKKAARKARKAEGAVGATPPAQSGKLGTAPALPSPPGGGTLEHQGLKADDGDGGTPPAGNAGGTPPFPGAAKPFGKKPKRKGKSAPIDDATRRTHDLLCPGFANKVVVKAYGGVDPATLDLGAMQRAIADTARKGTTSDVLKAAQDLSAAVSLTQLAPKSFADLRRAAHKGFIDAHPDMSGLHPAGLISPEQFRDGPIASVQGSLASTTTVPSPDLHAPLSAGQFDRGPLTTNETRPTLDTSGSSVAKRMEKAGRMFYTNADRDKTADAAGQMHDLLAGMFPDLCPLYEPRGGPTDSDGSMGAPAALNGPSMPSAGGQIPNHDAATLVAAGKAAKDAKKVAKVLRDVQREVKSLKQANKGLEKRLTKTGTAVATSPRRTSPFARRQPDQVAKITEARRQIAALHSRDSAEAAEAMEELRAQGVTPKQLARLVNEA
jgi:hypothetical protein